MMLSVAGGVLDGFLSSLAPQVGCPSAGLSQHGCQRTFWFLSGQGFWCWVVLRSSYLYASQCSFEELAPGRWRYPSSVLGLFCDASFCLPNLKVSFSVTFLCSVKDLAQNAVSGYLPATSGFYHLDGVKASHPSWCLKSPSNLPYLSLISFCSCTGTFWRPCSSPLLSAHW